MEANNFTSIVAEKVATKPEADPEIEEEPAPG